MKSSFRAAAVAAALVGSAVAAGVAHSATVLQIGSYSQVGGGKTFAWDGFGGNGGRLFSNATLASSPSAAAYAAAGPQWINVVFNFNDAGVMGLNGQLLFSASSASGPAAQLASTSPIRQNNLSGSFQFKYTGVAPVVVYGTTATTGANLLSGAFTNGWLSVGGTSGGFADSFALTGGSVVLSSAVIPDNFLADGDLGFAFTGLNQPALITGANGSRQLRDFRASSGGNFSAAAVPEPTTWVMMILGFGGAGAMLRRRMRLQTIRA